MPDLLQVTQPIMNQNQMSPNRQPTVQNSSIFDLVDLSKVIKTSDRSEQGRQDNATMDSSSSGIPKLPMLLANSPDFAAEALKKLLNADYLRQLADSSHQDFLAKINEFAQEVMLSPETLTDDLLMQQETSTMFSGSFFDLLRQLGASGNQEVQNAVLQLLKSLVTASQGQDVLHSLAGNLRYLAGHFSPSANLSAALSQLAQDFSAPDASENFAALKARLQDLMTSMESSLLATEKIKSLLPLLTHSLSRFSENPSALSDTFRGLLSTLNNQALKDALTAAFKAYVDQSTLPSLVKQAAGCQPDPLAQLTAALGEYAKSSTNSLDSSALSQQLQDILNRTQKQIAAGGSTDEQGKASGEATEQQSAAALQGLQEALQTFLSPSGVSQLLNHFKETSDLDLLLMQLSSILRHVDHSDVKMPLAQTLNALLETLTKQKGIKYRPPTSMESLVTFLAKNLGDNALRSLSGLNQADILSGLLTAPGALTPLLHFLLPLEWQNMRAFGELWVDPEGKNTADGEEGGHHLYLSFTVENIGVFDLEIYSKNWDISIYLHCPPEYLKTYAKVKDSLGRIAAAQGFSIKNTRVEPLLERRELNQIFPGINERRSGLNVTI